MVYMLHLTPERLRESLYLAPESWVVDFIFLFTLKAI